MYQKTLLSEKVAESIVTAIKNGFYAVGYKMPNEIQLSEELGVSRATLREAIKILISKNILEVRRGIGTFVSQTPGYSVDMAGLNFIDLASQMVDINRTMRYFDLEELSAYGHLSYDAQKAVSEALKRCERLPLAMLNGLLDSTEQIALFRNSHFRNRMISMTHEAFRKAVDFQATALNQQLIEHFELFVTHLGEDTIAAHYDDFLMDIRRMAVEG